MPFARSSKASRERNGNRCTTSHKAVNLEKVEAAWTLKEANDRRRGYHNLGSVQYHLGKNNYRNAWCRFFVFRIN